MSSTRPEIQNTLQRLRRSIRRYLLLEGLAGLLALAGILFWATFGLDWIYFQFSQLELPATFRFLCTMAMAALLGGMIVAWLFGRLWRQLRQKDLALALERRFPQLNDRLITTVENTRHSNSPLQASMLDRTAEEAARTLSSLPVEETIDPRPLRRVGIVAGALLASVLVLGLTNVQAMERWYQAYVLGKDDYWSPFRKNALTLQVVAQPGDRIRSFDAHQVYRHPRGVDLQLLAKSENDAAPPDRASLQFLSIGADGQHRGRITMSAQGKDEFRHTLARIVDDHDLWIRAGDFTNRTPFHIQVVDPPRVDSIDLVCDYPGYLGMDSQEDRPVRVAGAQTSLPMETEFQLVGRVNKPLRRVYFRSPRLEVAFGFEGEGEQEQATSPRVTLIDTQTHESRQVRLPLSSADMLSEDRREFRIPLWLTASAEDKLNAIADEAPSPLPIPPDLNWQIVLEDEDQIFSPEPASLALKGIVDRPPSVDIRRTGVGPVVTRMATLPFEGRIADDYGVADAWFGFRIDQNAEDLRAPLANAPAGQKEFTLQQTPQQRVESFQLIPLELKEGQMLTLSIYAADGDDINGPHVAHGETFTFKIVSQDELLARLYDREVNLRLRLETVRAETADLQSSLASIRGQAAASQDGASSLLAGFADRGLHQVRKNHTESRSIEQSFRDLREEMVNNRVDTTELLTRIERRVLEPMTDLNTNAYLTLDRRVAALQLALERGEGESAALNDIDPALSAVLAQMDAILAEMRDRGTFNDLIQHLQQMIDREKKLLEQTEDRRIEENFFTPLN